MYCIHALRYYLYAQEDNLNVKAVLLINLSIKMHGDAFNIGQQN